MTLSKLRDEFSGRISLHSGCVDGLSMSIRHWGLKRACLEIASYEVQAPPPPHTHTHTSYGTWPRGPPLCAPLATATISSFYLVLKRAYCSISRKELQDKVQSQMAYILTRVRHPIQFYCKGHVVNSHGWSSSKAEELERPFLETMNNPSPLCPHRNHPMY